MGCQLLLVMLLGKCCSNLLLVGHLGETVKTDGRGC